MAESPRKVCVDSSFKFDVSSGEYETRNTWAKLGIRKDKRRGDYYIDALFGTKGEHEHHTHLGINADQTIRFLESRGITKSIERKVESRLEGLVETKSVTMDNKLAKGKLTFSLIIDESSRTIKFQLDEVKLENSI